MIGEETLNSLAAKLDPPARPVVTPTQQFKRKYSRILNQIDQANLQLESMIRNGGGQVLNLPEYDKQIKEKQSEILKTIIDNNYEQNLQAKLEFINFQINILVSESGQHAMAKIQDENIAGWQSYFNVRLASDEHMYEHTEAGRLEYLKSKMADLLRHFNYKDYNYLKLTSEVFEDVVLYDYEDEIVDIKKVDPVNKALIRDEVACRALIDKHKEYFLAGYQNAVKAVKQANNIAEQHEELVLAACRQSIINENKEKYLEQARLDERLGVTDAKTMVQSVLDSLNIFDTLSNIMFQIVYGFEDLTSENTPLQLLTPYYDTVVNSVKQTLDPVLNLGQMLQLPLPKIGESMKNMINMILQMDGLISDTKTVNPADEAANLSAEAANLSADTEAELNKKMQEMKTAIEIPKPWLDSIQRTYKSMEKFLGTIPICLFMLTFRMISVITRILQNLGANLPPPLNMVSQASAFCDKVLQLYTEFPENIIQMITKKVQTITQFVASKTSSLGSKIDGIMAPMPSCPEAIKTKVQQQMDEEYERRRAEEKKKQELDRSSELTWSGSYKKPESYQQEFDNRYFESIGAKSKDQVVLNVPGAQVHSWETGYFDLAQLERRANSVIRQEFLLAAGRIKPNNTDVIQEKTSLADFGSGISSKSQAEIERDRELQTAVDNMFKELDDEEAERNKKINSVVQDLLK